jgi:hypothetical protein
MTDLHGEAYGIVAGPGDLPSAWGGRNTVRRALAADGPPKYRRPAKGAAVDAVEPQIRALFKDWPTMPAKPWRNAHQTPGKPPSTRPTAW